MTDNSATITKDATKFTQLDALNLKSSLVKAFRSIGRGDNTPRFRLNDETIAYEFYVAKMLSSLAKARMDVIEKEAIASQVIKDYKKFPDPAHEKEGIYTGDVVKLSLSVKKSSERLDAKKLRTMLHAKLGDRFSAVINECFDKSTSEARGAHTISADLVALLDDTDNSFDNEGE